MTPTQFLLILKARWKFASLVFVAIVGATIAISLLWPKKYVATASVVIDVKPDPVAGTAVYSAMMTPSLMATQVDVIQSERVAMRVVRNLKLAENPEIRRQWSEEGNGQATIEQWLSEVFQKGLDVKPSRESNVINISYKAAEPRFAAGMANAFVDAYMQTALELRVDPARQYSTFFDVRVKESREALENAQAKVSNYQREKGILATDERLDIETARLNELSTQLVLVQSLSAESNSRQAQANGAGGERMQEVLGNPVVAGLKVDISRAQARLKELSSKLGDRNPQVVEAQANIGELQSRLDAETRRATGGIVVSNSINRQRQAEISAALDAQRVKVARIKAVRDEGAVLTRDVENAQLAYQQVQGRANQTSLESQATQSNVAVLTTATPVFEPASPRLAFNALLGIFMGTLLAVGTALALELMNRRVRAVSDLVDALGLPVLGVIPKPNAKRLFGRSIPSSEMQQRLIGQASLAPKGA